MYGLSKKVNFSHSEAVKKITEELKKEGFGIIAEVDFKKAFKEKLNVDYKEYLVLEACNPKKALEVLGYDNNLGLLLPCNIVVFVNENDETIISVIKPTEIMSLVNNENVSKVAFEIEEKLKSAFERI